jgi:hypothetical protein
MTTRCGRPLIFPVASFAIALLVFARCGYARPQTEPPPQPAQQPSGQQPGGQQTPAQQAQPATPNGTPSSGQASSGQKPADPNNSSTATQSDAGSKDRLFFALPNFLTLENSSHVPPMTAKQKFQVAARSSFDYVQYPWYAVLAGISQAQNSEPGYGQGAEGYAKRYGSEFADGTIENFMVNAVVPSLIHTDPRYYQLGKGGFVRRPQFRLTAIIPKPIKSSRTRHRCGERKWVTMRYELC